MTEDRPYTLIAELTYACPLRCGYCSNPVDWRAHRASLDGAAWARVVGEAAELGVLALHLSGGEPLLHPGLESITRAARAADLFTTLVTSGVPMTREKLSRLREAGLDAVQLSLQDADPETADRIAGRAAHAPKLEVARWVRELGMPLTVNVVLHRHDLDRIAAIVELAAELGARRLELANVQLLAWALENRDALLPSAAQIDRARAIASSARERFLGRMEIVFVLPDHFTGEPRACMGGWARHHLVVTPDGLALPCHAAHDMPGLPAPRVTETALAAIWHDAPLFRAFRGEDWMPLPCRSCERRRVDFGGCRCQALALTGDPAATDPACARSPHHGVVVSARHAAEGAPIDPASLVRSARR